MPLSEMAKQLKAADAAKDDFLAVLSHELRTPLVPILGWAHLLKKQENSEQVRKAAEVIERNAQAQSRMIEDLLDINLITHGSVRLDLQVHGLQALIRTASPRSRAFRLWWSRTRRMRSSSSAICSSLSARK